MKVLSLFSGLFLLLSLTSCEKVIDIDLNEADKKYVIEGVLTDQPGSCQVLVSTTVAFNNGNNVPGVSGAAVTITDDRGNTTTLRETIAGTYIASTLAGVPGTVYRLSVTINGQAYQARCTMPQKVNFDSLSTTDIDMFGDKTKLAVATYQDPLGKGNCYRFIQYVNKIKEKTIFVNNDELIDGKLVNDNLFLFYDDDEEDRKMKSGDSLRVEMLCIDPAVYKYWYSLSASATGENQSATPANPVTNISGGALGYFSVHTFQARAIKIP
jgi:hypothetical protein